MPETPRLTRRPRDFVDDEKPSLEIGQQPQLPIHPLLLEYVRQDNAYYSLPRPRWPKREVRFSPSQAGKCQRELYYEFVNEEANVPVANPLQNRLPDVGIGLHEVRQSHLAKMASAPIPQHFRVKTVDGKPALEIDYTKIIEWNGESVKIKGRLDAILEFVSDDGEIVDVVWDLKSKTLKAKVAPRKAMFEVEKAAPQMLAYRIMTGIDHAIIPLESTQKDWSKDGPNADLIRAIIEMGDETVTIQLENGDTKTLNIGTRHILDKFATVVRAVREKTPPAQQRDEYYCRNLCPYADACTRHNQAEFERGGVV